MQPMPKASLTNSERLAIHFDSKRTTLGARRDTLKSDVPNGKESRAKHRVIGFADLLMGLITDTMTGLG